MAQGTQYVLWFQNQSTRAGKVCVYQNKGNVTANVPPQQLAWMVTGANPSTAVQFIWSFDYAFVWIDQGPPRSQQIIPADLATANSTTLSRNEFGYNFSPPSTGVTGQLAIKEDASVPAVNKTVAGIGMSLAGTFAVTAGPNQSLAFTPAALADTSYSITFGQYTFQVGDVIDPNALNTPGVISFPPGVFVMTAILSSANLWSIQPGSLLTAKSTADVVVYQAGKGVSFTDI
jgi:hypothetical protein